MRFAGRVDAIGSSAIRDLLALTSAPEVLSLAGGLPAVETFPTQRLADASARLFDLDPGSSLQYATTEGHAGLRAWVAAREQERSGVACDADDVVVTSGSQQALLLCALALCEQGDVVVTDDPGYVGGLQAFAAAGARLVGVPVDEGGLDVDHLARRLADGLRPVACYTVSTFQNPGGATMGEDRRRALAALADRYGFVVVDDDPYADLWFDRPPPAPVRAHTTMTAHLGSASKIVAPGLRVGWAVAPPELRSALVRLKQAADLQAPTLGQALLAELFADSQWFESHLAMLRTTYAARADALVDALVSRFGDRLAVRSPGGGLFVWASFLDGTDTEALLPVALRHGVGFVPGGAFAVDATHAGALRLSFATNPPHRLAEAVDRLYAATTDLATHR
jgi:2-aminoadipate transaminase